MSGFLRGFDLSPDPAVSPDGRYIAFKAQDRSHRTQIWLKAIGAANAAAIPGTPRDLAVIMNWRALLK